MVIIGSCYTCYEDYHCAVLVSVTDSMWIPVPCKRRSSVNSGAWLRRFDDVTEVAKTDILR